MMRWEKYLENNPIKDCAFSNFKMEGYLKKQVSEVKLFQTTLFPKRYFVIDYASATIFIKSSKKLSDDPSDKCKHLPFRSILEVYMPSEAVIK